MKKITLLSLLSLLLIVLALLTSCASVSAAEIVDTETETETVSNPDVDETEAHPWSINTSTEGNLRLASVTTPNGIVYSLPYRNYTLVAYSAYTAYVYAENKLFAISHHGKIESTYDVAGYHFIPEETIVWWWADEEWSKAGTFYVPSDTVVLSNTPSRWFD